MSKLMFSKEVQKKIFQIHLACIAKMKVYSITKQINAEINNVTSSMGVPKSGVVSNKLKTSRAKMQLEHVYALEELRDEMCKPLEGLVSDFLTDDDHTLIGTYENAISKANSEGAEIYDSVISFKYTCDEQLSWAMMTANDLGFKCSKHAPSHEVNRIDFYTTTIGARKLYRAIREKFSCEITSQMAKIECSYYRLPIDTPPLPELFAKHSDARLSGEENIFDYVCERAIRAESIGILPNGLFLSESEELEQLFNHHTSSSRRFERNGYELTGDWVTSREVKQIALNSEEYGLSDAVNIISA